MGCSTRANAPPVSAAKSLNTTPTPPSWTDFPSLGKTTLLDMTSPLYLFGPEQLTKRRGVARPTRHATTQPTCLLGCLQIRNHQRRSEVPIGAVDAGGWIAVGWPVRPVGLIVGDA